MNLPFSAPYLSTYSDSARRERLGDSITKPLVVARMTLIIGLRDNQDRVYVYEEEANSKEKLKS